MVAKKNFTIEVPKSVCTFSKSEIAYIEQASKMMPFSVDIQKSEINVPHHLFEEAKENLTVQHLISKFKFVLQSCIDAPLKTVFDPELKSSPIKKEENLTNVRLPVRGETWIYNGNERWYFKVLPKDMFEVDFLGSLKSSKKIEKKQVEKLIREGSLVAPN